VILRAATVVLLTTVALTASSCGGGTSHPVGAVPKRQLIDLHTIGQLQTAFNTASGEPRLIVLVSPT
jgi:hypothetical protein